MREIDYLTKLIPRYPYNYCFVGEGKAEGKNDYGKENEEIKKVIEKFLKSVNMKIFNVFESGKRIWDKVVEGIVLTPFGLYIVGSYNRNVHIEIGYGLAKDKPVLIIIKEDQESKVDIASDIVDLFQIRYKDKKDLAEKLGDQYKIPHRYFSPFVRLRIFLESATVLQKYLVAYLLVNGKQRLADIVTDMRRCIRCDNTDVTDFVNNFKEFLDIDVREGKVGDKQLIGIFTQYKTVIARQHELKPYLAEQKLFVNKLSKKFI